MRPLLATIPPMNPAGRRGGGAMLVPSLNDRIYQVGAAENLAIVDVYAAFNGNLTLLGDDGLHPNAAGYQVIAKAFADAIRNSLEVKTTSIARARDQTPSVATVCPASRRTATARSRSASRTNR